MKNSTDEYLVFEKIDEIWQFLTERWRDIASEAIGKKGRFSSALSGGKTPVGFYRHLSTAGRLPWDRTHLFVADERCVPSDSPDNNFGMIRETLVDKVAIPPENIHPVPAADLSARVAAEEYEEELKRFFGLAEGGVPEFDLILLGIGEDGHTASLFPGTAVLRERERLAAPVTMGPALHDRVTLTFSVLNNALNVFFLACGKRKRTVMKKLRSGFDKTLPAAMVRPKKGRLFFLMDRDAGG
ncbi:MAG: 6-phosphogluconolactonase [Nitrospirae bacterium]|nr:6-phosphogluconolactonase [Nitrospirota bacterium]